MAWPSRSGDLGCGDQKICPPHNPLPPAPSMKRTTTYHGGIASSCGIQYNAEMF